MIFDIIFIFLFSILILRTKFYRHHLFSIMINILCLIILAIIDITNMHNEGDNMVISFIYLFIRILSAILYPFCHTIGKLLFLYNFITTYALLLNKSIFHFFT